MIRSAVVRGLSCYYGVDCSELSRERDPKRRGGIYEKGARKTARTIVRAVLNKTGGRHGVHTGE